MTDWSDPNSKVSKFFTVRECTFLPRFSACHQTTEIEQANIIRMASVMDAVRELVDSPISVHVWIRPTSSNIPDNDHNGENYNSLVGGASRSAHISGLACDFDVKGSTCDEIRALLEPKLEELGARMERKPGSGWVHLDVAPVPPGGHRYFTP
jgi:hypothetical protein